MCLLSLITTSRAAVVVNPFMVVRALAFSPLVTVSLATHVFDVTDRL
jgi:hypothetical protein